MQDTTLNTGSLETSGVDLNVGYHTDLNSLGLGENGSISASMVGTWLESLKTQPLPGGPSYDCASKAFYGHGLQRAARGEFFARSGVTSCD